MSNPLVQLLVSLGISVLGLVLVLGLLMASARQVQAGPLPRPLAAPGTVVTHTAVVATATHQMTVFGNGQLTNQFLADNISRTNLIGARISHTTVAVLFNEHAPGTVDVGSQLEFVEVPPPIAIGPPITPGYYEESYGVYASTSLPYQIAQRTLMTSSNNCVIMELTISNTGVSTLTGGMLLYMVDVQVGRFPNGDEGGFDPSRQMVYQTDFNVDGYAFGISLLSGNLRGYAVQDAGYLNPASDLALRNEMITPTNAITNGNDDVSWLVVNIPTLSPQQSSFLAFNLCGVTAASESGALNELNGTLDNVSNLAAVKTSIPVSGSPLKMGDLITYTIAVASTGSYYVDNIMVTDTIPAGTDLITYSVTQGSISAAGPLVTATIGRLYPSSGTVTVTIVVDPLDVVFGGDTFISNRAYIDSQPIITYTNIVTHNPTLLTITKQSTGNWDRRVRLTFTNTTASALAEFPVLVKLNGTRINYSQVQNAGQDLRFVDPDGTVLAHEIEQWNESGDSYVWVNVPQVEAGTTDYIWMYYGDDTASDGQNPAGVWNSNYVGVWHLNEAAVDGLTTTIHSDSTANGNHGTQHLNSGAGGYLAGGQYFSSATNPPTNTEYIKISNLLGQPTQLTLSAWVQAASATGDIVSLGDVAAIRVHDNSWGGSGGFYHSGSNTWPNTASPPPISGTGWRYLVYTYQAGSQRFYLDGVALTTTTHNTPIIYTGLGPATYIGTHGTLKSGLDFANGTIDEVRVSSVARSPAWVTAQYQSMSDNFISYGTEETVNVMGGQTIAGLPVTYNLTVGNSGPVTATNVVVTDTLPAGATYISGGTLVGNTVNWTIGTIAPDDLAQVSFVVSTCQLSLVNAAYQVVNSTQGISSEPGEPLITLLAEPTINVGFTSSPLTVTVGTAAYFTATGTTNGSPLAYTWNFGDGLGGSGSPTSHIYTAAGIYTVTLTATDRCGYSDTVTGTVVVELPVLALGKQVSSSLVQPGETFTYTLFVSNTGMSVAPSVVVTDIIPAETTFVSATEPYAGPLGRVITWSLGNLNVNETRSLTLAVRANNDVADNTVITNTAWLTSTIGAAITNNDSATTTVRLPRVSFTSPNYNVNENAGPAVITVTLDTPPFVTVTVVYSTSPGTAVAPGDYSDVAGTLTFGPQTTMQTFTVNIVDDVQIEPNETIILTLRDPAGVVISPINPAVLTIVDDDFLPLVTLVKTGPITAAVEQTIVYSFAVSSNITLSTVVVTDSVAGAAAYNSGDNGNNLLEPGETWFYTAPYTVGPFAPLVLQNTGYVAATDIYGSHLTATATHATTISFNPGLFIQKTGPAVARVGDTVVYDIIVTNATTNTFFGTINATSIGDGSPITITQVTDSLGPATYIRGNHRLSGTEQLFYRITHTIQVSIPNPLLSQASVWGLDKEGDTITATTTMRTDIDTTLNIFLPIIFKN